MSTLDAIAKLIGINNAVDKRNKSICIFVDLAKAFGTVDHEKLLAVLDNVGIRGSIQTFFEATLVTDNNV